MTRRRRWGSITRHGDGWRARAGDEDRSTIGIYLDADFGDRAKSEIAAEEALEEARRTWLLQQSPRGRGITLLAYGRNVLDRWERADTRRGLDQDRDRFERHIARAPFAADPLVGIERRQIQRWIRALAAGVAEGPRGDGERKRSRRTVLNVLTTLRAIIRAAIEDEVIDENPTTGIIVPKSATTEEDFLLLDRHEVLAIVGREPDAIVSLEQLTAVVVAVFTGARPGELWGLRWRDVELARRPEVIIRHNRDRATKGGRVRRVPLLEPARAALARWHDERPKATRRGPLVFPNPNGRTYAEGHDIGWAPREIGREGREYWTLGARWQLGIHRPVNFKDLRHTCACALLRGWWVSNGWIERPLSMVEIAQWLGHRSVTTTEKHYARLAPGGLLDVVPKLVEVKR